VRRCLSTIAGSLVTLMATLLPVTASAQPRLRVTARLEFAETYDDNLFPSVSSPVRQSDVFYRIGPRFGLAYTGRDLSIRARYGREAEAFAWRPELDSTGARQDAAFEVGWSPGRTFRLDAGALFEDTNMARDLNVVTGLETARLPAQRFSIRGSASLRLGRLARLRAEHGFLSEQTSGFPTVQTHVSSVVLERRVGNWGTASMIFSLRELGAEGNVTTSRVLALGWSRQLAPRVSFEVKAGPRRSDDGTGGAEVSVGVRGILRRGDVSLEYTQTEATAAAHLARLAVQGVSLRLQQQLHRDLWLRGGPGVFESRDHQSEAVVYRANAELEWRIVRRVALTGSYVWSRQEGNLGGPALRPIPHNTFSLRLAAGAAGS
jgi:hypothetical protein